MSEEADHASGVSLIIPVFHASLYLHEAIDWVPNERVKPAESVDVMSQIRPGQPGAWLVRRELFERVALLRRRLHLRRVCT